MEKALSVSGFMMNQVGPRNTAISSGFYSLIRAIRRANSRAEEDRIVEKELELIRQNLAQPDISQKKIKEFLVRLMYCEMLGQSANFAYIHALKMAQQGSLLYKRVGYLAVCLFLHPQHELVLLLVNTIQRDLRSTNILDVCVGLTACSQLIGPEMIPAILPLVEEKLQHPQEVVRKKAVLALHSFLLRSPQFMSQMGEQFQGALCDRAPGVMNAALHIFNTLIGDKPEQHKSLVRPLTAILSQVVQRKLTAEFEFRGVPAPWMQIQILNMLARLGANNTKLSQLMYDVLEEVLDSTNTVALISCGVQYECIMTISKIHPHPSLLKKAASFLAIFLKTRTNNLRYIGLKALGAIHRVYPECSVEHQMTVVECLEDEDVTIRKATLNLLYQMCNRDNIKAITEKLLDCMETSSEGDNGRKSHIHKIVRLAQQFHPSVRWYVDTVTKILSSVGDQGVPADTINKLIIAIQNETKDTRLQSYLVQKALSLANQPTLSNNTMELVAWILGEYGCTEHSTIPNSETLALLCSLLTKPSQQTDESSQSKSVVISALMKAVGRSGLVTEEVNNAVEAMVRCRDVEMRQKAFELQTLCGDLELLKALCGGQADKTQQYDWTLSFLDEYVSDALEQGTAPYKPKQQRSAEKHNSPEVMRPFLAGLNFKPYASPSASQLTTTGSSGSLLPSNQENITAASSSPQASISSGATGNSAETEEFARPVGLKLEGVRKVWSQSGYTKQAGNRKKSSPKSESKSPDRMEQNVKEATHQPTFQMTSAMATGTTTMRSPHPEESEEERRKKELATALFGNMRKTKQDKQESRPSSKDLVHDGAKPFLNTGDGLDRVTKEPNTFLKEQNSSSATNHDMLLDIEMITNSASASAITRDESQLKSSVNNQQKHIDISSENVVGDKSKDPRKENFSLDEILQGGSRQLKSTNQVPRDSADTFNNSNVPSLLDMDDAGQGMMMSSRGTLGEVPSLPAELGESPSSHVMEELVFDANLRLMMRRVWPSDALVLVFFLSSLGKAEDVKLILDVPSNIKCFINDKGTNIIEFGSFSGESPSTIKTAKLTSQVPAAHMSLGGELSYRDSARTQKRLFFQAPVHIRDLIRPKEMNTEEFGKLWPELSLDHRLVLDVKGHSLSGLVNVLRDIHLFPVEIIGNEGIIAGSLLAASPCLIHLKLESKKLDLWVRSRSKLLSQVLAKNCSDLLVAIDDKR